MKRFFSILVLVLLSAVALAAAAQVGSEPGVDLDFGKQLGVALVGFFKSRPALLGWLAILAFLSTTAVNTIRFKWPPARKAERPTWAVAVLTFADMTVGNFWNLVEIVPLVKKLFGNPYQRDTDGSPGG